MTIHLESIEEIIDKTIKKEFRATLDDKRLSAYASKINEYRHALQDENITARDAARIFGELTDICNKILGNTKYSNMLQGKGTNALAHTSKKAFTLDTITGTATATTPGQVLIAIENFASRKFNVQTQQIFDLGILKLTRQIPYETATAEIIQKNRAVTITVEEFMTMRNLKDVKEARSQLEEAFKTLYSASLEFNETRTIKHAGRGKPSQTLLHYQLRIVESSIDDFKKPLKNGAVTFKFTSELARYLSNAFIMPYPQALLTINSHKNPHSYHLGRKLALHHNLNFGKANENRITVQSLLEACPNMPTYEDIMSGQRHVAERIINPFMRDMDALVDYGILTAWGYCNSGGIPLTDEQYKNARYGEISYSEWATLLVDFELADYPDQSDRIKKIRAKNKTK